MPVNGHVLTPKIAGRPAPTNTKHLEPLVGASLLANHAGQRPCSHAQNRRQASSYKYKTPGAPCRSQPAGESCRSTCITAGEHSLAGQLPQGKKPGLCLCRSQPAGESCRQTCITAGEHSLAGQLPQGKKPGLCLCRSQPAGESCRSTGMPSRPQSPAGQHQTLFNAPTG